MKSAADSGSSPSQVAVPAAVVMLTADQWRAQNAKRRAEGDDKADAEAVARDRLEHDQADQMVVAFMGLIQGGVWSAGPHLKLPMTTANKRIADLAAQRITQEFMFHASVGHPTYSGPGGRGRGIEETWVDEGEWVVSVRNPNIVPP